MLDLDLPDDYAAEFPGPAFGVEGTRDVTKVRGGPLVGTIIKPSIGLSPEETAELVNGLCEADIDFIKDDELIGNPPYAPIEARVKAVMKVVNRHADRMGRKVMIAFNISDDIDAMRPLDRFVVAGGDTSTGAVKQLDIDALEMVAPLSPGARSAAPARRGVPSMDENLC